MYQRGEDQNKQTGFWGMIKSVTSTQTGSESILHIDIWQQFTFNCYNSCCLTIYIMVEVISLDFFHPDLSLVQQEVDALEELSRQLFLETVDLQSTKVMHGAYAHTQTHT